LFLEYTKEEIILSQKGKRRYWAKKKMYSSLQQQTVKNMRHVRTERKRKGE
jgi:hypothetical protein